LEAAEYAVKKLDEKTLSRHAYPPLITSTMQRLAGNRLGWSAKKTMREAQQRFLISKGVDVHARSHFDGSTPLSWAAYEGNRDMVEFLISMGADIHTREDHFGKTPLHLAAEEGHKDIVGFLVCKGANVHAKDNAGLTPLRLAALKGHLDVVKFLVGKGASAHFIGLKIKNQMISLTKCGYFPKH